MIGGRLPQPKHLLLNSLVSAGTDHGEATQDMFLGQKEQWLNGLLLEQGEERVGQSLGYDPYLP